MGKKITLVNEDANPSEYTTSDPTTITQLKSQGYVEKTDEADSGDGGADGAGASSGAATGSTKAKASGSKAGEK